MWGRRIARRMPWSRVPLRRGTDKAQAWITLATVVVTLLVAPWVAWWTASATYLAETRANEWEGQHHRPVTAVLVQDAPRRSDDGGQAPPAPAAVSVPARWTGPDGVVCSGMVSAAAGAPAGSSLTIWVDQHGIPVLPPRRRNSIVDASVTATLAVAALFALLCGVRRIAVWRLDRRRLRAWGSEWLIVGPRWSRR